MRSTMPGCSWIERYQPQKRVFRGQSYLVLKRAIDILLVFLFVPIWLPLMGAISLVIFLGEPGAPVIFVQERTGKGGKRFGMYKFRTMVPNAEQLKVKYASLNELKWPDFKISNDPRITRTGRFLRKTSLDELPQLVNVLKGDLSLVGPRPTSFSVETYQLWHTERLDVQPGLTGLWQVSARSDGDLNVQQRLDSYYIRNWSPWLDYYIVARTLITIINGSGAY